MGTDSIAIALAGSGGSGVMTAGELLLDAAARSGGYGLLGRAFGPQIRGGEAAALLRLGGRPITSPGDTFDLLLALDWQNVEHFLEEIPLHADSVVVADPDRGDVPAAIHDSGTRVIEVPLKALAAEVANGRGNMIALGLAATVVGLDPDALRAAIRVRLGDKGEAVLEQAGAAVTRGAEIAEEYAALPRHTLSGGGGERWIVSGNEAAGLGALLGGVRFAAGYPITPSTDILEWLATALPEVGGTLIQAEDELAAVNMCLGASFGGVPALTATSGPGYALMAESLGLGVASETPMVTVDVMRCGPSTGIPTKSEQADLNLALYGRHGDAPHPVLAPTGVADCLVTTRWAVELAETLQVPVTVLSDQRLGQSRAVVDAPEAAASTASRHVAEPAADADYRRYQITADGVSPMSLPGTPSGMHVADGLEHDEIGRPSTRMVDHQAQSDKRWRKLSGFDYGQRWAEIEGDGPLAVIAWGGVVGAVREALTALAAEGIATRLIGLRLLAPLRTSEMAAALDGAERVLIVEQNHSGQLYRYLRGHFDFEVPVSAYHRPGPLPLRPGEIRERVRSIQADDREVA